MGCSPSADLYYGYDLGDLIDRETYESLRPQWWEDDDAYSCEWEDELARRLGSDPGILAGFPVEIESYGYGEDPTWAVRVKASVQTVDDYGSTKLEPLVVAPEWDEQIARFVELLELNVPDGGPAWHLNCSYG